MIMILTVMPKTSSVVHDSDDNLILFTAFPLLVFQYAREWVTEALGGEEKAFAWNKKSNNNSNCVFSLSVWAVSTIYYAKTCTLMVLLMYKKAYEDDYVVNISTKLTTIIKTLMPLPQML